MRPRGAPKVAVAVRTLQAARSYRLRPAETEEIGVDRWRQLTTMAREYPISATRNIGIMAHIDAGKTTTTERILYYTGRQLQDRRSPRGRGDHGLDGAGAGARHHHHLRRHHLLLAPTIASTSSTRPATSTSPSRSSARCACSTARWRCSTRVAGVQPQSETVWRQANRYDVPRIAFVNKMDRVGADFDQLRRADSPAPRRQPDRRSSCRSASRTPSAASSTSSR